MVYIVLLAYNEEEAVGPLLKTMARLMESSKTEYRFIVVNDGSVDKTKEIVASLRDTLPIDLLSHKVNKGVGAAFTTGLHAAASRSECKDIIITMEADFTNDPKILTKMIEKIDSGYTLVCASRYIGNGKYIGFPFIRLFFSKAANYLFRVLIPTKELRDYTIFYRAYSAKLIQKAIRKYGNEFITLPGFSSNLEILLKLRKFGAKCGEVAMEYKYNLKRGSSKMHILKNLKEYSVLIRKKLI